MAVKSERPSEKRRKAGVVLSPTLFNFAVDWLLSRALSEFEGVEVGWCPFQDDEINFYQPLTVTDLDYADDIAIMADSIDAAQSALNAVQEEASMLGLLVSAAKTKVLCCGTAPVDLQLGNDTISAVDRFTYLGSNITADGAAGPEVNIRIGKASAALRQLNKPLWSRPEISLATKLRIYDACIYNFHSELWLRDMASAGR